MCDSQNASTPKACMTCGLDFETGEIGSEEDAKARVRNWVYSRSRKDWPEIVMREKNVHDLQVRKHGEKGKNPGKKDAPGWSQYDTARLLGRSKSHVSHSISLATELKKKPWLRNCRNKTEAIRRLEELESTVLPSEGSVDFTSELELQKYLQDHWEDTELGKEWGLVHRGKFDTGEVGIIDLLAKHKEGPSWLVIELKVGRSSDEAVGQVLRYMGWIRINCATEGEKVQGLVVSKSVDATLLYALICVPDVDLQLYALEEEHLRLDTVFPRSEIVRKIALQLPEEEQTELMEKMKASLEQ